MPTGALIMGGASLAGGILGGKGASKAAKAQQQASEAAIAEQRREYDLGRADLAPYRDAGGKAIGMGFDMLQPGYDYTASPGYDFRLSEGLRGVENSAAAKGLLQSGGTLKGIDRYAEGLAAQDFNDQFNRAMSVASGGQQAATNSANMGQQTGANIGNLMMQAGNAKASGYAGQNQAIQGTLGNLMSLYGMGAFGGMGGAGTGAGAGLALSDQRIKKNIVEVGRFEDGLPIVEFEYDRDLAPDLPANRFRGVLAQDVERLRPWAFVPNFRDGFAGVDYGVL